MDRQLIEWKSNKARQWKNMEVSE